MAQARLLVFIIIFFFVFFPLYSHRVELGDLVTEMVHACSQLGNLLGQALLLGARGIALRLQRGQVSLELLGHAIVGHCPRLARVSVVSHHRTRQKKIKKIK